MFEVCVDLVYYCKWYVNEDFLLLCVKGFFYKLVGNDFYKEYLFCLVM